MNVKWQITIFAILVIFSVVFTGIGSSSFMSMFSSGKTARSETISATLSDIPDSRFFKHSVATSSVPIRKWDVLDLPIGAEAALVQSLDEKFPFVHYRTGKVWPIASLTKLLTAVVVLDEKGGKEKITITQNAVDAEGTAGNLVSGEVYTSEDLLKVMLITSSNDAAVAFEDYFGGKDKFVSLLNKKAGEIGMSETVLHDASGLSDLNISTASDLLKLTEYIIESHPDIIAWTRLPSILIQPVNNSQTKALSNIHPFINNSNFLGGKTGTLPEAKQNLLSIFSFNNFRVAVVILGSSDRVAETNKLFNWINEAYEF